MHPGPTSTTFSQEFSEFLAYKKQMELSKLQESQRQQLLNLPQLPMPWPSASPSVFGTSAMSPASSMQSMVLPRILPNGVQLPMDRSNDVNNFILGQTLNSNLQNPKNYLLNYSSRLTPGISTLSLGQPSTVSSLASYVSLPTSLQSSSISPLGNFTNPLVSMPLQTPVASIHNQDHRQPECPVLPLTPKPPSPQKPSSPLLDVETVDIVEPIIKKQKTESEESPEDALKFVTKTTNMLPILNNDQSEIQQSCNQVCQNHDDEEPMETHIIITSRPPTFPSIDVDDKMSTDSESDYDTNLRPKETPLQYKDRMIERAMRKNLASKRSREKRKREHEKRQAERQKLEQRNIELASKLMELKESLNNLRPQICSSCNEQVQNFLDKCHNNDGMNIFVLRPCFKPDCRGNKNYDTGVKKSE